MSGVGNTVFHDRVGSWFTDDISILKVNGTQNVF